MMPAAGAVGCFGSYESGRLGGNLSVLSFFGRRSHIGIKGKVRLLNMAPRQSGGESYPRQEALSLPQSAKLTDLPGLSRNPGTMRLPFLSGK